MITNVLEYLETSARKYPDKKAFADKEEQITYAKLLEQAQRVGTYIRKRADAKNHPIAVTEMPRRQAHPPAGRWQ